MTTARQTEDPARWDDLFVRDVDEQPVQFVRPADTDRPTWSLYEAAVYRGTVTAESDGGRPLWRVQGSREAHRDLDDAIRALRRPSSWTREREQVTAWAHRLLADDSLLAVDVETTGLENAYAVQIAAVDRCGTVVFNEYVQPNAPLEPAAVAVHGITPDRLAQAPVFGELLPRLTELLHGRIAVAYKMDFDRGVIERELHRHHRDATTVERWLARVRWEDAMVPYAVWRGLWSVKRGTYRNQPLGGPHDAVADARVLIAKLEQMVATPSTSPW
ncbi:3'-5' exonuclease [Streptomyces somaliensis]|uniref:3'-5' exonuclease n=1 Tax=Streptomyces somaliensis TaxID=78355 RepID=UPI0020CD8A8D|nr:3'-5' exonuclease [Streptomyces somaliensis]MCP9946025.1 3'-5' exonuclease [Streptomyces somaliensis]MCP9960807.1 3'-5' exonuclease [Streptomyces somaliensis]